MRHSSASPEPSAKRSSGPTTLICPGCGTTVAGNDVDVMFVGDVVSTPVQIGKCVLVGLALGLVVGAILPRQALHSTSIGALLVGAIAWLLARRYNRRVEREPVDLWPHSVTCPECGRVFGRYPDTGGPDVLLWP